MSDDGFREAELLNQYVRGAYEEEGESDLSLDGTTSSRSASESSNSEAETFFSLDEDGVSVRCEILSWLGQYWQHWTSVCVKYFKYDAFHNTIF